MGEPRLVTVGEPRRPAAVVLVLHGGGSRRGDVRVSPAQLSVLRMIPVARRLRRVARRDLVVLRLLNSSRGWDTEHTPVDDVLWALDRVRDRHPGLPVGLVGHSLGGRAALLAGGAPDVRSVVALNPYVVPGDSPALDGRRVLVIHGDQDRIASPARSLALVERLGGGPDVGYVTVQGAKHAMLRRGAVFERAAGEFTTAVLLDRDVTGRSPAARVLAGERRVTV